MSEKSITLTLSLPDARTVLDCIDGDMDLSTHNQPCYQDVGEMSHNLRRAEVRERLLALIKEAAAAKEDVYVNACDDENCECRKSSVFPSNIRSGCACKEVV